MINAASAGTRHPGRRSATILYVKKASTTSKATQTSLILIRVAPGR
jgi:hypothetical protein